MALTDNTQLNAALPNPRADMEALDALERTLFSLGYAMGEIGSLGPVIDPPKATEERAEALATLQQASVEALCDPAVGSLLDRLVQEPELVGKTRMAQIKILKRDRAALVDVPAEEQAEFSRLTVEANDVWRRAKAANDWASFEPYVDRIVEIGPGKVLSGLVRKTAKEISCTPVETVEDLQKLTETQEG